ncbi:MAG: transposase [Candidatus Tectomicrobia bacterium]|uniref:Transposase n=1 Tax=Tectimicrobiota bacterium TaxID=2528274 RepID=A0A932HVW6_UNCTE|nr:transposase [Candidatus Tectomicrobia bacterium]
MTVDLPTLHDLAERGLKEPLLVCSDGMPVLRRALLEVFPRALKKRCQVQKMRDIIAKLLRQVGRNHVFTAGSFEKGLRRGKSLIALFRGRFPRGDGSIRGEGPGRGSRAP